MLRFVDITDANDDLLMPWLDLYETSFPPEEKVLVSSFLQLLKDKAKGEYPDSHMQAVLDDEGRFVALLRFDLINDPGATYLWYIAVHPDARSGGIGSACFQEVVRRATEAGLRAVVFEVEIPDHSADPERQDCARRRIEFYRRMDCLLLTGIHYMQRVTNQPAIPMYTMIRPIEPVTPQEAFEMVTALLDGVTQVGELGLE
jgi:ribosomal protein S18 acetylase RimI-like enzyme